jgi:hypothetical protein
MGSKNYHVGSGGKEMASGGSVENGAGAIFGAAVQDAERQGCADQNA